MPCDGQAPDEARTLLLQHVETFDKLEILVHLWRYQERAWTAELVAAYLQMNAGLAASLLSAMCASGLLSSRPGPPAQYEYRPHSEGLARAVDALASLRDENRLWITNLMIEGATTRLNRTFAKMLEERIRTNATGRDGEGQQGP